ncbi:hypothetical protein EVAR_37736_1 [Eumeta japonica]|uniref:Uncharacterized protein n=1 Tax=Eumeta variegata TaxID=151549 RepID=A0A4C1WNB5_EUMVA|nr:hypothetical protein EVAR_37736_1 [Eumeta japonica]
MFVFGQAHEPHRQSERLKQSSPFDAVVMDRNIFSRSVRLLVYILHVKFFPRGVGSSHGERQQLQTNDLTRRQSTPTAGRGRTSGHPETADKVPTRSRFRQTTDFIRKGTDYRTISCTTQDCSSCHRAAIGVICRVG